MFCHSSVLSISVLYGTTVYIPPGEHSLLLDPERSTRVTALHRVEDGEPVVAPERPHAAVEGGHPSRRPEPVHGGRHLPHVRRRGVALCKKKIDVVTSLTVKSGRSCFIAAIEVGFTIFSNKETTKEEDT